VEYLLNDLQMIPERARSWNLHAFETLRKKGRMPGFRPRPSLQFVETRVLKAVIFGEENNDAPLIHVHLSNRLVRKSIARLAKKRTPIAGARSNTKTNCGINFR
jgi:hypothetical protein